SRGQTCATHVSTRGKEQKTCQTLAMHALCWPGHGDDWASTTSGGIHMSLTLGQKPWRRASLRLREQYLSTWTKVLPQFTLLENQLYISSQTVGESLQPLCTDGEMTHKPKTVTNNTS